MPITIACPECEAKFRVPDTAAGRKVKCPKCTSTFLVPMTPAAKAKAHLEAELRKSLPPVMTRVVAAPKPAPEPELWQVKTIEGKIYGPVTRAVLQEWLAEGRLDHETQLLRNKSRQWQWATEVFPELEEPEESGEMQPARAPEESKIEVNPFAQLGGGQGSGDSTAASGASGFPFSPQESAVTTSRVAATPVAAERDTDDEAEQTPSSGGIAVSRTVVKALAQTKPWVLLISILGLVGGGIGILAGLAGAVLLHPALLINALLPAIGLTAAYYLLVYAQQIDKHLKLKDARSFEAAMIAQMSFWKLAGIVTLVNIAIVIVSVIVAALLMPGATG